MEHLPVELRQEILQRMDLETLKVMRLTTKSWASLGEEYLMPAEFSTLPHRNDIDRVLAISRHPKYSYRIQSLFINLGEINEWHARHNAYFMQYMRNSDERSEALETAWSSYALLKEQTKQNIDTFCELPLLMEAFSRLPNLRSISVSLMTSPFKENSSFELFHDIWRIPTTRRLPRAATTSRFTALLAAISSSSMNLQTLSHDRLPFEFFAQTSLRNALPSSAFQTLTSLTLTLDHSDQDLDSPPAFRTLAASLLSATALHTLSLSFLSRAKISISPLLTILASHCFSKLANLELGGMTSTEDELGSFLVRQTALRRVRLGNAGLKTQHQPANGGVHLREGSFRGLFTRVEGVGLERLEVMGDLVGWESGEKWILDSLVEVGDLREYVID